MKALGGKALKALKTNEKYQLENRVKLNSIISTVWPKLKWLISQGSLFERP